MRASSPCSTARGARRGAGPCRAVALLALLLLLGLAAGCGRRAERDAGLSFEDLSDTSGLSRGAPILTEFEPYRLGGGAMRVRGRAALPDGARLQIKVVRAASGEAVQVVQVTVVDGAFESAPFMAPTGPLPEDLYRFEVLAHFNSAWQSGDVLRATDGGRRLRGPGITRGTAGQPALFLRQEVRL